MRARTFMSGFWGLALVLLLAGGASAREVTLTLTNGREITGQLVSETADSVTVRIAGIETTYPRSQVGEMQVRLTLADEYQMRRDQLADDNYEGRYELAYWLYQQGTAGDGPANPEALQLAMRELDAILQAKPDHEKAGLLRTVVASRLEDLRRARQPATPNDRRPRRMPRSPRRNTPAGRGAAQQQPNLLSEEQVNLIKAFEVHLDDQPRVVVPREVVNKIFEQYRDAPALEPYIEQRGQSRFRNLEGYEQLGILFNLQARELYKDVLIRDEPETLREFRIQFHRNYALRYCGSCHSERRNAPGLKLTTRGANNERMAYTNLLTLRRTNVNGTPLIDTSNPEQSPLLQYGLPREEAITPHPEVRGWRPSFTGSDDPRFQRMADWIDRLWSDRYPVDFEVPGAQAEGETQPAGAEGAPQGGDQQQQANTPPNRGGASNRPPANRRGTPNRPPADRRP